MSFSWGSTNNNNNNNNNKQNNNSSNGFSWGSNANSTPTPNPNNNTNTNTNTNNASNSFAGFGSGWGTNNSNQNNTQNTNQNNTQNANQNTNQNNTWSWGSGNNQNNNNQNQTQQGETSGGWANNTNNNNNNNNTQNSNSSPWNSNSNNNNNNNVLNPNNDHIVSGIGKDAISGLKFHNSQPHFIVSCWDNTISYYELFGNNQTKKLGQQKHDKPVLDCCFDAGGSNVLSAGCDNLIKLWNPQSNKFSTIGQHQSPVRCVQYNNNANVLISGSWDKCIAFWDVRSSNTSPAYSSNLGNKVYAMSTKSNYLVVALSDNDIKSFDLRNNSKEIHSVKQESGSNQKAVSLKRQVRCIDIFPNSLGYVAASIGGRVIIKHFDRSTMGCKNDFSYKCHRVTTNSGRSANIFGVNVIKFHQQSSIFATGGDDGEIVTWDKDGRAKLFTFKSMQIRGYNNNSGNSNNHIDNSRMPIVALDYHSNGQYMVYATSYNWNKGLEFNDTQQQKPQVYLHQINNVELDKNKKK